MKLLLSILTVAVLLSSCDASSQKGGKKRSRGHKRSSKKQQNRKDRVVRGVGEFGQPITMKNGLRYTTNKRGKPQRMWTLGDELQEDHQIAESMKSLQQQAYASEMAEKPPMYDQPNYMSMPPAPPMYDPYMSQGGGSFMNMPPQRLGKSMMGMPPQGPPRGPPMPPARKPKPLTDMPPQGPPPMMYGVMGARW
ncbi:MAG: hypothetical protein MHM6MM_005945 [Cercozoa sp. M6MM]